MTAWRVLFYVQNLLGIGHVVRVNRIAEALARHGFDVHLVSGGVPVAGLRAEGATRHQLSPVKAGEAGFSDLVHPDGRPFGEADRAARRDALIALFHALRPDILITEAFPFGRRQMRFELLPLLEAATSREHPPLIAASVRDILQDNRRPGRAEEIRDLVVNHYDRVLVHGDPALARLDDTFPLASAFTDRVVYTGIVGPPRLAPRISARAGIIVSAGGGAVGGGVLRAALAARTLNGLDTHPWLFVGGPNLDSATRAALEASAGPRLEVAAFLPDLPERFHGAALSISQAGYNSAADLLAARCRAVLIPFATAGETEQTVRAQRLQELGLAMTIPEDQLTPECLAAAIARALALPEPKVSLQLDGAHETARSLRAALR